LELLKKEETKEIPKNGKLLIPPREASPSDPKIPSTFVQSQYVETTNSML